MSNLFLQNKLIPGDPEIHFFLELGTDTSLAHVFLFRKCISRIVKSTHSKVSTTALSLTGNVTGGMLFDLLWLCFLMCKKGIIIDCSYLIKFKVLHIVLMHGK